MSAATHPDEAGRTVTALFKDRQGAEHAYAAARALGYEQPDINLVMSDQTRARVLSDSPARNTQLKQGTAASAEQPPKGSEMGGPVGGTIGTLAPVIAAIGTVALIPGLVLAGPVAVALTAAGAVGIAGGLIGALTDWGIPHGRVEEYERGIREGGILMGVKAKSMEDARQLEREWQADGGALVQR